MTARLLRVVLFLACASAANAADTGTLLVLNKSDDTVSLLDLASGEPVSTLKTGEAPHEVTVSPDGKMAVISNYGTQSQPGNTLTVIDIPGNKVLRTIDLGANRRPHGLAWLEGNQVAVTTEDSQSLLIVDVDSGKVLHTIGTGASISHMVAVAPKHQRAFVANIGSGSVTVIDLGNHRRIANIPTGAGAEGIDVSADQNEVWVTNREADTVSIIDVRSLKVVASLESRGFPIRAKFTPDGKHVLVSHARSGDVGVFDAASRKSLRRIPMKMTASEQKDLSGRMFNRDFSTGPVPVGILVAPGLKQAFVANTNADIVSAIDLTTWQIVDRLTAGKEPDGLGYSPLSLMQSQAKDPASNAVTR